MKYLQYKNTLLIYLLFLSFGYSQDTNQSNKQETSTPLFSRDGELSLKMSYDNKKLKKLTNDSTYLDSKVSYSDNGKDWNDIDLELRTRGNFRKNNCYFTPLKFKIKKKKAKGTLFEGEKLLKLVLPCLKESVKNDNVIKELMAYKIYEIVSPYYFKTRLVDIEFEELKSNRSLTHNIKGFLVEDDKSVAKRIDGNVSTRPIPPLGYDPVECVRNAMFQFMIGNTDWSATYQHNMKLIFMKKRYILVPYDFDMAGLVNSSYAVVSQVRGNQLPIEKVTERLYVGYQRDRGVFEEMRKHYLSKRNEIFTALEDYEKYFENSRTYEASINFLKKFFDILNDDKKFEREIINKAKEHKQ